MARSKTYMNVTSVTISYGGGPTTISLTEVTNVQSAIQDVLEPWVADGHKFPTLLIAAMGTRSVTIFSGDIGKLMTIPKGTACTVSFIFNDSVNTTSTGAVTFTLSNAVLNDISFSGPSNKFAGGSATFMLYSSNGSTDPLAYSEAS